MKSAVEIRRDNAVAAAIRDVESSFLNDIVLPGIKDFILDAVHWVTGNINDYAYQAVNGGEHDPHRDSYYRDRGGRSYVAYDKASSRYARPTAKERREEARQRAEDRAVLISTEKLKSPVDPHKIIFRREADARDVHGRLMNLAAKYGEARMSDLYQHALVGIEPAYTDQRIGWTLTDIRRSPITHSHGGYVIDLPPYRELEYHED